MTRTDEELARCIKDLPEEIKNNLRVNFDALLEEYQKKSTITEGTMSKVIGPPPQVTMSPDMDTLMLDYEKRIEYSCLAMLITETIASLA